jgi:hypothetical protein
MSVPIMQFVSVKLMGEVRMGFCMVPEMGRWAMVSMVYIEVVVDVAVEVCRAVEPPSRTTETANLRTTPVHSSHRERRRMERNRNNRKGIPVPVQSELKSGPVLAKGERKETCSDSE